MKKLLSLFLVLILFVGLLPMQALSEELPPPEEPVPEENIVEESQEEPQGEIEGPQEAPEEEGAPEPEPQEEPEEELSMGLFSLAPGESLTGDCGDGLTFLLMDGVLTISGSGAMWDYVTEDTPWFQERAEVRELVVESGVTSIGINAFEYCDALEDVTLPAGLTSIGRSAFYGCRKLKQISIPNSVTGIGEAAFLNCSSLESANIPTGVKQIEDETFAGCDSLAAIVIPDNVESIGKRAFANDSKLKSVSFFGSKVPKLEEDSFEGVKTAAYYPDGEKDWTEDKRKQFGGTLTWFPVTKIKEHSVLSSGRCGKTGTNLLWVLTDDGTLTVSGSGLMEDYVALGFAPWYDKRSSIKKAVLKEGISSIGERAFFDCPALESISLPKTLTQIGESAFEKCSGLKSIQIPESVSSISAGTFNDCSSLSQVTLPNGLVSIGNQAFCNCDSLKGISLPPTLSSIGAEAFAELSNRLTVDAFGMAPSIATDAFKNSEVLFFYPEALQNGEEAYTWSEGVMKEYGGELYWMKKATSGSCGTNLTWTLDTASGVLTVSGSGKMKDYDTTGALGEDISVPWLYYFGKVHTVVISEGVTTVGDGAFKGSNVRALRLPESLQSIGEYAFLNNGLDSLTVPNETSYIAESAFAFSPTLKHVTFGTGLKEIANLAFALCPELEELTFLGNAPIIGSDSFGLDTATAYCPIDDESWTDSNKLGYGGTLSWISGHCVKLSTTGITAAINKVSIDGVDHPITVQNGEISVILTDKKARLAVAIANHNGTDSDPHTRYPTAMYVWMLEYNNGVYTAKRVKDLDNCLQYAGSSIRITGEKGIRMITSVPQKTRNKLMSATGIEGYTLEEYGTLVAWVSELGGELVIGAPNVKMAYAYKKGTADPIFNANSKVIQYTNVLTKFELDECIPDLAMRPYMKLVNKEGEVLVLYGGMIQRNIGYIAYQNRSSFKPKTSQYAYIWEIIHHVYGSKYDSEYKTE